MALTPAQKSILKSAVIADSSANNFYINGDLTGLADYLNSLFNPAFIVWKLAVTQQEIMLNGFDWTRVDNLSIGKARIWEWMFEAGLGAINPSNANIRAGIDQVWQGTAADLAVRAAVYVHCKRSATVFEKVFAVGAGTDVTPANLVLEGPIATFDLIGL